MSQMKKTESMNTPARTRLRSRFSDIAPTNAGGVDAAADEAQPTTSRPKKRAATRPPAKSTTKKTKNPRQTKRKGAAALEPEPAAPTQDHAGDEEQSNPVPAVDSSTPAAKKTVPPTRQGTRASARLRGKNVTVAHDQPVAKAEVKRTKRAREADTDKKATTEPPKKQAKRAREVNTDNKTTTELPKKRAKRAGDRTDAPAQAEATTSHNPSVDPVPSEDATVDHPEQPADAVAEESAAAGPSGERLVAKRRFYLREDRGMAFLCLGTVLDHEGYPSP